MKRHHWNWYWVVRQRIRNTPIKVRREERPCPACHGIGQQRLPIAGIWEDCSCAGGVSEIILRA